MAQTSPDDTDEVWATLQNCNITLSLGRLLDLMLQFRDKLTRPTNTAVALLAPTPTPHIRDDHCPTLAVKINDHEISGVIIDGGSGFNVISEAT